MMRAVLMIFASLDSDTPENLIALLSDELKSTEDIEAIAEAL